MPNSLGRLTRSGLVMLVSAVTFAAWAASVAMPAKAETPGLSVTTYTGPGISQPNSMTVGPDGALWFTNYGNNSIGRISTTGVVTNYTDPRILHPGVITAGPDGALWFTNSYTIGRITTDGVVR